MKAPTYPGEVIFLDLAQQWKASYQQLGPMQSPKRATDLQALAAMLLTLENPKRLSADCLRMAEACEAVGAQRYFPWVDGTPWRITIEALQDWSDGQVGVDVLVDHLDESRSALRGWALEMAWFVRARLDRSEALPKLLGNVEDTLAYVTQSWGLAGALCATGEIFEKETAFFQAERFEAQYEERRKHFSGLGLVTCQAHFWKLEASCRQVISDSMGRIYYPQIELEL